MISPCICGEKLNFSFALTALDMRKETYDIFPQKLKMKLKQLWFETAKTFKIRTFIMETGGKLKEHAVLIKGLSFTLSKDCIDDSWSM